MLKEYIFTFVTFLQALHFFYERLFKFLQNIPALVSVLLLEYLQIHHHFLYYHQLRASLRQPSSSF